MNGAYRWDDLLKKYNEQNPASPPATQVPIQKKEDSAGRAPGTPFWQWGAYGGGGAIPDQPQGSDWKEPTLASAGTGVQDATAIYNQMIAEGQANLAVQGQLPGQGPAAISVGTPPPQEFQSGEETWRGRIQDGRGQWPQGDLATGVGMGTTPEEMIRRGAPPQLSEVSLDLPEYEPPKDRTAGVEKGKREELYQRARGDLREQTHNAIISARSLDNPMAQAQFVSEVLKGMGQGLGEILGQASGAASQYAAQKRAEELGIYNAKFKAESAQAQAQYDAELQQAMAQWQADMTAWESGEPTGRRHVTRKVTKTRA